MKYLFFIISLVGSISLYGQKLNIGVKFQKTHSLYWENGITAQYSFANFKAGQFYLGFDYVTSRLGSAAGSNALKQDSYLLSAAWYFSKEKPFHVTTRLNV
ncbi:MAG: hypothetical protein H6573_25700 [Lewinellaceae bacterium]|nr:hypothetical protein [Phaeodactylibacter sp.]MCB0611694.1 hypothetical protein [Phaeodactylibacter sp.]MCB9350872.1 hypothetical protein [Lewinellaceae bacterium]